MKTKNYSSRDSATIRAGPKIVNSVLRKNDDEKPYHTHGTQQTVINMMSDEPENSSDSSQEMQSTFGTSKINRRKPGAPFTEESTDRDLALLQLDDDFSGGSNHSSKLVKFEYSSFSPCFQITS